ncbi:MAG TPA: plastocyanin/azurin family copper-binding protein [Candidatus Dormibacteraeota bacterium]|nr:plastocyanin/azurin family copper-binding protein [Candidatus Dormibacteraeota bacterium]
MWTLRRRLVGALLLPLLAACGSATSEISPDNVAAPAEVTPNACSVIPHSAVATAVSPPTAAELPPASPSASASSAPLASPPGVYEATSVGSHPNVGQCTYRSALGPTLVVSVYPNSTLAGLADITTGLHPLGPTLVSGTDNNGLLAFQDGDSVVGIALDAGGLNQSALARRLGTAFVAITGAPLTLPELSASAATSTGAAVPTPLPAAGAQVTGVTANQTVQQTNTLKFDPASVSVSVGGVVLWDNSSSVAHNVTFDANPELTSQTMNGGDKFELKFTRAGQYAYHCTFHPGMDGTVTVS